MNRLANLLHQSVSWREITATTLAGLLAGLFLARQLMVILAAEQGRKQDLVRRLSRQTQEFRISILIPFLDPDTHSDLLNLLHAISIQDYPEEQVRVHLVTREDTARDLVPESLRPNVRVWKYPGRGARYETALDWLITRCLAMGGGGMFVFLKPTDIIKTDFLRNIASRGLDASVIQGYLALKNPPVTTLEKVCALSTRLFNRIGNAGRYHLGMSCRLLDSGWAIKPEVLEMIPFHRGMDVDNLEYTLRLNLEGFRVHWAPGVVVYSDARTPLLGHVTLCVGAFVNRLRLLFHYGPRLMMQWKRETWEQCLSILMPPHFMTTGMLLLITFLGLRTDLPIPGAVSVWLMLGAFALTLNILGMAVARCKPTDYTAMLVHTPIACLLSLPVLPLAIYIYLRNTLTHRRVHKGALYRNVRNTRFNEAEDTPSDWLEDDRAAHGVRSLLKENAPTDNVTLFPNSSTDAATNVDDLPPAALRHPEAALQSDVLAAMEEAAEASDELPARRSLETIRSVPVSNGKKQINCRLKMLTSFTPEGQESYRLTLEYKNVAFSTSCYRILDQAFYELHTKLMSRGLTMITCGSCGRFYNPTVDVPEAIRNSGVCLYDKEGREVNLNTDAVTVVSPACAHHCPLERRESIVRQWKESLTALSRTS